MSTIFPVIFTETADKETPVLAYIPDLDGMTEGKAIADAIAMAKDYICNALFDKANPETPNTRIDEIDLKESPFLTLESPLFPLWMSIWTLSGAGRSRKASAET